jgi:hypothetical protein
MKGKQIRTKSILQLEFYSCLLLRNKKLLYKVVSLPRIRQTPRWPQKEREETFETQKALRTPPRRNQHGLGKNQASVSALKEPKEPPEVLN